MRLLEQAFQTYKGRFMADYDTDHWVMNLAAYENSLDQVHDYEAGIETIMDQLRESDTPSGAFYCEFGVFKKIYELSARRLRRFGYPIHIALVDLHLKDESKAGRDSGAAIEKGMDMLRESILSSLRSGDVVTRYST